MFSHFQNVGGRPDVPEMVQPFRSITFPGSPGAEGIHVEHMAKVDPLIDMSAHRNAALRAINLRESLPHLPADSRDAVARMVSGAEDALGNYERAASDVADLTAAAIKYHDPIYDPWDVRPHNVGLNQDHVPVVFDGGAVGVTDPSKRIAFPHTPPLPGAGVQHSLMSMDTPAIMQELLANSARHGVGAEGGMVRLTPEEWTAIRLGRKAIEDINAYAGSHGGEGHWTTPLPSRTPATLYNVTPPMVSYASLANRILGGQ
jgi:hypothetical protein